jgi:hypothetical protein
VGLFAAAPGLARAYCRTTTLEPTAEEVREHVCIRRGEPLFWSDLTIHYGFNPERASQDLDEATVRAVFAEAFATWAAVDCESGAPGFEFVEDAEPYSETHPNHHQTDADVNAMLFRPGAEWFPADPYDPNAFALTSVWYRPSTGRLLGADMEINEGKGPYAVCDPEGCPWDTSDLRNVVTHEVGHLLGFNHSNERDATMFYSAQVGQLTMRDLSSDDIEAQCDVYSPDAVQARARSERDSGCSLAGRPATGSVAPLVGLALMAGFIARRRRSLGR